MILSSIFYKVIGWLNYPSTSTPLGQKNLRYMDNGILQCAQHIVSLSQDKAELDEVNTMVQDVSLDVDTGILTILLKNGTIKTYDLAIEKVVLNFEIDDNNNLILTLADGSKQIIDLTRFVYAVDSTATIAMQINNRIITADVVDGSITLDKLEKSVVNTLRQYMFDAQISAESAALHDTSSQSWAIGGTGSRNGEDTDNSKYYSEQAKLSAEKAGSYVDIVYPEFVMDYENGHLYCIQGKNVTIYIEDYHVMVEVA